MKIQDIMVKDVITVSQDATVGAVAKLLNEHNITGIPVIDDEGALCGVVSEADLLPKLEGLPFSKIKLTTLVGEEIGNQTLQSVFDKAKTQVVSEIMQKNVITIEPTKDLSEAAMIMSQGRIKRLPVVEDGKIVGLITRSDVVRAISGEQ